MGNHPSHPVHSDNELLDSTISQSFRAGIELQERGPQEHRSQSGVKRTHSDSHISTVRFDPQDMWFVEGQEEPELVYRDGNVQPSNNETGFWRRLKPGKNKNNNSNFRPPEDNGNDQLDELFRAVSAGRQAMAARQSYDGSVAFTAPQPDQSSNRLQEWHRKLQTQSKPSYSPITNGDAARAGASETSDYGSLGRRRSQGTNYDHLGAPTQLQRRAPIPSSGSSTGHQLNPYDQAMLGWRPLPSAKSLPDLDNSIRSRNNAPSRRSVHDDSMSPAQQAFFSAQEMRWREQLRNLKRQTINSENRKKDMWVEIQSLLTSKSKMNKTITEIEDNNEVLRRRALELEERIQSLQQGMNRTQVVATCPCCAV